MTQISMNNNDPAVRRSLLSRTAVVVLRWAYRLTGGAIILSALLVLFAQTDIARNFLRTRVLWLLNEQIAGTVVCDDIHLDIFRGLVLHHPQLYADGTQVIEAERLSLTYDLAALFGNVIAVSDLQIVNPRIAILKSKLGVWNIDRIALPTVDTIETPPPNFTIRVRAVSIQNGRILVNDMTQPWGDGSQFDPLHMLLQSVELRASVRLALQSEDYSVAINHLSFYDQFSRTLDVRRLSAYARLWKGGLSIPSLSIRTAGSSVDLSAVLDGVNLLRDGLSDSTLKGHPITATVYADRVVGEELRYYLPDVDFAGNYALRADAGFDGDVLNVTNMHLTAGESVLKGSVRVAGVAGDGQTFLQIGLNDSKAKYSDIRKRLRFVDLPELEFLTTTYIRRLSLKSHPSDSVWFDVEARDSPGEVHGQMTLYVKDSLLGYKADLQFSNADLAKFTDSTFSSRLQGRFLASGTGITLEDVKGNFALSLGRSVLLGEPIRSADISLVAYGNGLFYLDSLSADVTPFRLDSIDEYSHTPDDRLFVVKGDVDLSNISAPKYRGSVGMSALNLAELFNDDALPRRVTGMVMVDGGGISLDSAWGSLTASINEFSMEDRALMPFGMTMNLTRDGVHREFELDAPFATARITGDFAPSALIDAVLKAVENVSSAVQDRIKHLYSDSHTSVLRGRPQANVDATFDIDIRDFSPINIFLGDLSVSMEALCKGRIQTSFDSLMVRIDTLSVSDMVISGDSLLVMSDPIQISGMVRVDEITTTPQMREIVLQGTAKKLISVNGLQIEASSILLVEEAGILRIQARSIVDGIEAGLVANATFSEDSMLLEIDSFRVKVDATRRLEWSSIQSARVGVSAGVFKIDRFRVKGTGGEIVNAIGAFTFEEFRDLEVQAQFVDLATLSRFVQLVEGHPVRLIAGSLQMLSVRANGPFSNPQFRIAGNASGVRYNGELIGELKVDLLYKDQDIQGAVSVLNPELKTSVNTLDLTVKHLPVDLSLSDVKQRFVDGRPIDIELTARDLALASVEPFLPAIERLHGVANGEITVRGVTPNDVKLGGQARFVGATFLSSPTNIHYQADGVMHLDGSTLHLDTIVVRNIDRDKRNGIAYANGTVEFNGLSVDRLDFFVRSPGIVVLNKSSQARSPKVFGDVVIATGYSPVHFYGRLDAPVIEGDIDIMYADVIFPQERSATRSRYTAFKYINANDTDRRFNSVLDVVNVKDTSDDSVRQLTMEKVATAVREIVKSTTASFTDILRYDLNIYLKGRTIMTMVFGTFEILIADIEQVDPKIPLVFTGRFVDNSTNLRGKVRVKEGTSTYKFYKPFAASGTLDFTLGGMSNPSLDLRAVYKDRRYVNEVPEDYRVQIDISGTKLSPIARWSIYRNDRKQEGDSAKINGDAIMLILVGRTQDEMVSSGQGNLVNEINASFSAVATSALGDLLGGLGGLVQSTQVDLGSDFSQSRMTVSGQLWSDVSYRLSGQISDIAGNSTLTITVPFSILSDAEAMRYFMLDVSRSVNNAGNVTRFQRLWEVKLGARLP